MKLSNVLAKLTGGKAKVLGGLLVAGAAFASGAPAANAQVAFGVTVGPRYYAPAPRPVVRPYAYGYVAPAYPAYGYAYGAPGYWDHRRYDDWRAHEYVEHRDFDRGRDRGGYWRR